MTPTRFYFFSFTSLEIFVFSQSSTYPWKLTLGQQGDYRIFVEIPNQFAILLTSYVITFFALVIHCFFFVFLADQFLKRESLSLVYARQAFVFHLFPVVGFVSSRSVFLFSISFFHFCVILYYYLYYPREYVFDMLYNFSSFYFLLYKVPPSPLLFINVLIVKDVLKTQRNVFQLCCSF